jgi:hypothetical protein
MAPRERCNIVITMDPPERQASPVIVLEYRIRERSETFQWRIEMEQLVVGPLNVTVDLPDGGLFHNRTPNAVQLIVTNISPAPQKGTLTIGQNDHVRVGGHLEKNLSVPADGEQRMSVDFWPLSIGVRPFPPVTIVIGTARYGFRFPHLNVN